MIPQNQSIYSVEPSHGPIPNSFLTSFSKHLKLNVSKIKPLFSRQTSSILVLPSQTTSMFTQVIKRKHGCGPRSAFQEAEPEAGVLGRGFLGEELSGGRERGEQVRADHSGLGSQLETALATSHGEFCVFCIAGRFFNHLSHRGSPTNPQGALEGELRLRVSLTLKWEGSLPFMTLYQLLVGPSLVAPGESGPFG